MRAAPTTALRRARVGVSAVFAVHSCLFANWVTRIPDVKRDLALSDGQLGAALLGMGAGAVAALWLGGWLVGRFGSRPVIRLGIVIDCATLPPLALAWSVGSLALALAVSGAVMAVVDVAMNAHGVAVESGYGRPIMSSLHGLWSVAGLAGAVTGGLAARAGLDPLAHFTLVASVLAGASLVATRWLLPAAVDATTSLPKRPRGVGWSPAVVVLSLIAFCSFVGEGAAADWSAVYLREHLGTSAAFAAAGFAAFSLAMAASRFVGDRLTVRFGPVRLVRASGVVAGTGLGLGLLVDQPLAMVVAFGVLGVGLSSVVPVAFSAAGRLGGRHSGVWIARVATLGYLGSLVGPPVIGFAADLVGLRAALAIPVLLAGVITAMAGGVGRAGPAR